MTKPKPGIPARTSQQCGFLALGTRGAFTLVELVMTVAIIATLAAIAVPKYVANMDRYRVNAAGVRLACDIALARSEAVRTSSSRTILFDRGSRSYTISNLADLDRMVGYYHVNLSQSPYYISLLAETYVIPFTNCLTFDGFGQSNSSALILLRAGQHMTVVTVDQASGKVAVY